MLNIERFEVGQSYVVAKVQNRYRENVTINIQRGRPGIELQASFFKWKEEKEERKEGEGPLRLFSNKTIKKQKDIY